jgi:hypothetical protein
VSTRRTTGRRAPSTARACSESRR